MSLDILLRKKKELSKRYHINDYVDPCISCYPLSITHNCATCASKLYLITPEKIGDGIYISNRLTLYEVLWQGDKHNIIQAKGNSSLCKRRIR